MFVVNWSSMSLIVYSIFLHYIAFSHWPLHSNVNNLDIYRSNVVIEHAGKFLLQVLHCICAQDYKIWTLLLLKQFEYLVNGDDAN